MGAALRQAVRRLWTPEHLSVAPRIWIDGDLAVFDGSDQLTAIPNTGSVGGSFTVNGTPTKATLNGLNGLRSTSTSNTISQAFAWSGTGVMAVFAVFDVDTIADTGTGSILQSGGVAASGAAVLLIDYDDPGGGNALVGNGYDNGPRAGVAPSPYDNNPHFALFAAGTSANDQWVDGVQQTLTENVSGAFPAYSSRTWTFLAGWGAPIGGDAYQIILLDYIPTTDERQKLEGWASWKYGLQANLPSAHPHRNWPPTLPLARARGELPKAA